VTDTDLAYALTWLADAVAHPPVQISLADAALYYAGMGWPVLPLTPGGKQPLAALAPNGLDDATTDPTTVAAWWQQAPTANIGLRTGIAFDAIDLDVAKGADGIASFWQLVTETGQRPELLGAAVTPTGGRHLLIAPTGRGNAVGIRPGVDMRGDRGYIVAAPSVIDGRPYTWVPGVGVAA
jgi:hypothetical protein